MFIFVLATEGALMSRAARKRRSSFGCFQCFRNGNKFAPPPADGRRVVIA